MLFVKASQPTDDEPTAIRIQQKARIGGLFAGSDHRHFRSSPYSHDKRAPVEQNGRRTGQGSNEESALPEQIVKDVIPSALHSIGQRCSAACVLYVQENIADKVSALLAGAMAVLKMGSPHYLLRFAGERTLTINTTAAGGNASLLTIGE